VEGRKKRRRAPPARQVKGRRAAARGHPNSTGPSAVAMEGHTGRVPSPWKATRGENAERTGRQAVTATVRRWRGKTPTKAGAHLGDLLYFGFHGKSFWHFHRSGTSSASKGLFRMNYCRTNFPPAGRAKRSGSVAPCPTEPSRVTAGTFSRRAHATVVVTTLSQSLPSVRPTNPSFSVHRPAPHLVARAQIARAKTRGTTQPTKIAPLAVASSAVTGVHGRSCDRGAVRKTWRNL
jgi:hypothetical protein